MGHVQNIVNVLREKGVTVHEWAGWQTRGTSMSTDFVGGIIHHTATAYGMAPSVLVNGRPDLKGPLCNFAGNHDGSITVIAAGVANHAGASGGRSMGPLPVTSSFNRYVVGLEIVYPGTQPMTDAQYRTACIWARVVADVVGRGNIESVRAHAETSVTGKWDPGYAQGKTIDMNAFRRDASHTGDDDLTPDQDRILRDIRQQLCGADSRDGGWSGWASFVDSNAKLTMVDFARWTDKNVSTLVSSVATLSTEVAELKARLADVQNYSALAAPRLVEIQSRVTELVSDNTSGGSVDASALASAVVALLAEKLGA